MQINTYKILLLSGGADSLLLYQKYKYDKIIFFDYGQPHMENEYKMCEKFVDNVININKLYRKEKYVNCRNMLFITYIVSMYGDKNITIHLGTNSDDKYLDNNYKFYKKLEKFINLISIYNIKIELPLIKMSKQEIIKELNYEYYTD